MRVLVVEDSKRLLRALSVGLRQAGFVVDIATTGIEGLRLASLSDYKAIVLDLMLPEMDGFEVITRLRAQKNNVAVLVLTARDFLSDKLTTFGLGADDYLVKPFAFDELIARLRALIRRHPESRSPQVSVGNLRIDTAAHQVFCNDKELPLTPREFCVLRLLADRVGRIVSRDVLDAHLFDGKEEPTSNVNLPRFGGHPRRGEYAKRSPHGKASETEVYT